MGEIEIADDSCCQHVKALVEYLKAQKITVIGDEEHDGEVHVYCYQCSSHGRKFYVCISPHEE